MLAFGLGLPASASVYKPGTADTLCAEESADPSGCLPAARLQAAARDGGAEWARPGGVAGEPVREGPATETRISDIAALSVVDRAAGAANSGDAAASLLFWVIGSGLLGLGFVARRRKPRMKQA